MRFKQELASLFKKLKEQNTLKSKFILMPTDKLFTMKSLLEQQKNIQCLLKIHKRRKEIFFTDEYKEDFLATAPNDKKQHAEEMIKEEILTEENFINSLQSLLNAIENRMSRLLAPKADKILSKDERNKLS